MYYDPSWTPDEPQDILRVERTFLAGKLLIGVGYGAEAVLYVACIQYLWSRRHKRLSVILLVYLTVLFLLESAFLAVQAISAQDMLIDHRNYPGGPWEYFLAHQNIPINVAYYALLFSMTCLADLLVVWRCWVIWSASGAWTATLITFLPGLALLGSFVMGNLWMIESTRPGLSLYDPRPMRYGQAYYSLSVGVNIVLTILIIVRLSLYQRKMQVTIPEEYQTEYISLITIFVESASLYSVFGLVFIVTYALNDATNAAFLGVAACSQQIAAYLIIYRLGVVHTSRDMITRQWLQSTSFKSHSGRHNCSQRVSFVRSLPASTELEDFSV